MYVCLYVVSEFHLLNLGPPCRATGRGKDTRQSVGLSPESDRNTQDCKDLSPRDGVPDDKQPPHWTTMLQMRGEKEEKRKRYVEKKVRWESWF